MAKVSLKHSSESFEQLMRRFKRAVEKQDIIQEVREREHFEKPSARRKRAKAAAVKRAAKVQQLSGGPRKRLY